MRGGDNHDASSELRLFECLGVMNPTPALNHLTRTNNYAFALITNYRSSMLNCELVECGGGGGGDGIDMGSHVQNDARKARLLSYHRHSTLFGQSSFHIEDSAGVDSDGCQPSGKGMGTNQLPT